MIAERNATRRAKHYRTGLLVLIVALVAVTSPEKCFAQVATAGSASPSTASSAEEVPGKRLFELSCSPCHDNAQVEAPLTEALRKLSADHILQTMNSGSMIIQSGHLSARERQAVASYLGTASVDKAVSVQGDQTGYCPEGIHADAGSGRVAIRDWGFGLTNERTIEGSRIGPGNVASLELDWVFAFPNAAEPWWLPR